MSIAASGTGCGNRTLSSKEMSQRGNGEDRNQNLSVSNFELGVGDEGGGNSFHWLQPPHQK
jgi:hypothetical protein